MPSEKKCIETLTAFHLLAKLHDKSLLVYLSNAWDLQQLIAYTAATAFVTTVKLIFSVVQIPVFFFFFSRYRSLSLLMPFLQQKTQSEVSKRVFYIICNQMRQCEPCTERNIYVLLAHKVICYSAVCHRFLLGTSSNLSIILYISSLDNLLSH